MTVSRIPVPVVCDHCGRREYVRVSSDDPVVTEYAYSCIGWVPYGRCHFCPDCRDNVSRIRMRLDDFRKRRGKVMS